MKCNKIQICNNSTSKCTNDFETKNHTIDALRYALLKIEDKLRLPYIQQTGRGLRIPVMQKTWNETSNQKLTDMNNEQLERGIALSKKIAELKKQKCLVEKSHDVSCLRLKYGEDYLEIFEAFLDFTAIKKSVLFKINAELNKLEKEFKNL